MCSINAEQGRRSFYSKVLAMGPLEGAATEEETAAGEQDGDG